MSQPTSFERQSDILTPAPNRQRKLILAHKHDRPAQQRAQHHLVDLGRLKRVGDQYLQRLIPAHDVNTLATQLIHDILDSRTPYAHAGTHRVDLRINRSHRDLRPVACLPRQGPDLNNLVLNLRNLELEKPANEVGMCPAQDDLDPLTDLPNVKNDRAHPLARVMALAWNLLASR